MAQFPVIYSEEFLKHQTGRRHPESPQRLTAIVEALRATPWADRLDWRTPTPLTMRSPLPWIEKVHTLAYIEDVQRTAHRGGGYLDPDTPIIPASYDVALLAVNAWLDAVEITLNSGQPVFVAARPPGHHALRDAGMGFCIFGNAAIAAYYALSQPQIQRVAILDWDVHHGNGTQALVEHDPQIAYCSLHQGDFYPGTGHAHEQGHHSNVLNIPLQAGSTLADYHPWFENHIVPFLQAFNPDLLIVSAGYDANADDPLASISLSPQDYGTLTDYCLQVTHKIVFGLEGGYHLPSLAQSVVTTIAHCLNL